MYQGLLSAISFLTIIPMRRGEITGSCVAFFPLVGLMIGCILFLLSLSLDKLFPKEITIAMVLLFYFIITGGLHLDGFSDTLDGISCQDKEKALWVMEKGNIGTFAVISLFFLLLLKFLFLLKLPEKTLIFLPVIGRWAMVVSIAISSPAKENGLGKKFIEAGGGGMKKIVVTTILTLIMAFLILKALGFILVFCIAITTIIITKTLIKRLGGMTGDTFGAISEVSEGIFLIGLFLSK